MGSNEREYIHPKINFKSMRYVDILLYLQYERL